MAVFSVTVLCGPYTVYLVIVRKMLGPKSYILLKKYVKMNFLKGGFQRSRFFGMKCVFWKWPSRGLKTSMSSQASRFDLERCIGGILMHDEGYFVTFYCPLKWQLRPRPKDIWKIWVEKYSVKTFFKPNLKRKTTRENESRIV